MKKYDWNEYQNLAMQTMRSDIPELTIDEAMVLQACMKIPMDVTNLVIELDLFAVPPVRRVHFTMLGLIGESGEFIDLLKKMIFHKQNVDKERIIGEAGDVFWYLATTAEACHIDLGSIKHPKTQLEDSILGIRNAVMVTLAVYDIGIQEVLESNVSKLHSVRYPNGFTFGGGADRQS